MNKDMLLKLLESVATSQTTVAEAADRLRHFPYEDIDYAHIDHHRSLRKGFPEVISGKAKKQNK